MRLLKRMAALTLAAGLAVTALAGCGDTGGESSSAGSAPVSQAAGTAESQAQKELRHITVYSLAINPSNVFYQWQQDYMAEKIGVNVEIIPGDPEKLQPMLAAGDLPDVGKYSVDSDPTQVIESGLVMDLTPYEDRLPNYTRFSSSVKYSKEMRSAGTGKLYAIYFQIGSPTNYPMDLGTYACNLRWDIYEAAGKPEVTDMYSLLDALKKMKEVYPETPDGLPVYAIGLHPQWDGRTLYGATKYLAINGIMELDCGYVNYDAVNDRVDPILEVGGSYYEALKWLNTANRMGLLDPDSMTQTYEISQAKTVDSGQYLTAMTGNYFSKYNTTENVNADPPRGFMPLIWDDQHPVVNSSTIFGDIENPYFVSASTKELDACLDFLNLMFDEDACATFYGGPQGELWDVIDGSWVLTDEGRNFAKTGEHTFYTGETSRDWWGAYGLYAATLHSKTGTEFRINDTIAYTEEKIKENKIVDAYEDYYGVRRPIEIWRKNNQLVYNAEWRKFIEVMPTELQDIQNNVKGIVTQDSWKIVMNATSDAEVEAMFREMAEKANAMGAQELVTWGLAQIKQAQEKYAQFL